MSIVTTTMMMRTSMSTDNNNMIMTRIAPADIITTIIMTLMKYLQAGVQKPRTNLQKSRYLTA